MSIRVMTAVWALSRQKGSALLALLAIADFAHDDGHGAFPSVATLAKKIRMSERQTVRLLGQLEVAGELGIQRGAGPAGTHLLTVMPGAGTALEEAPAGPLSPPVDKSVDKVAGGGDKLSVTPDARVTPGVTPMSPKPSSNRQEGTTLKPPRAAASVDKTRTRDARDDFAATINARMEALSAQIRSSDDGPDREALIDELDKLKNLAPTASSAGRRRGLRDLSEQCPVCSADPGFGCLEEIHALVAAAPPPPTAADKAKAAAIASRLAEGLSPYPDDEKRDEGPRPLSDWEVAQGQARAIRLWEEQTTHVRNPYNDPKSKNILAGLTGRLLRAGAPAELIYQAIREYGSSPKANPAFIGEWLRRADVGVEINAHLARKAAEKATAAASPVTPLKRIGS